MAKKEEKPDTIKQLFGYAGNYRYLTIASWVLATISAFVALVPFYFIWRLIKEVLRVAPDYGNAQNLSVYGWSAVAFAIGAMLNSISLIDYDEHTRRYSFNPMFDNYILQVLSEI